MSVCYTLIRLLVFLIFSFLLENGMRSMLFFCSTWFYLFINYWASVVAQMVKNLSAMQETWVWSLGHEYSLEKEMATHSTILACKIPWAEEPEGLQSMGLQRVRHDWAAERALSSWGCAGSLLLLWGLSLVVGEQRLLSSYSTWASHCGGFSCWGAQPLDLWASYL